MQRILLLGNPVSHSCSPAFQNAGIKAARLNAIYQRQQVTKEELGEYAELCREHALHGANITLPHKKLAADLVDEVTEEVELTGVANTWWIEGRQLYADNTDIYGVQASLAALHLEGLQDVVILGAGGAASGAAVAVRHVAETLTFCNRTIERAKALKARVEKFVDADIHACSWPGEEGGSEELKQAFASADVIIQATSLPVTSPGWEEPFERLPWHELQAEAGLLELSYADHATVSMRFAAAEGAEVLDGATMLLHQGLRSFRRWFGIQPPAGLMRDALSEALNREAKHITAQPNAAWIDKLVGANR